MDTLAARETISVLIVDDHPLLREGVKSVLAADPVFEVVDAVGSARAALDAVERLEPDIALVDVSLKEGDGIALCEKFQQRFPRLRILVLTKFTNDRIVANAFRSGAHGFLVKAADLERVREAVKTVARGESYVDPEIGHAVVKMATNGRRAPGSFGLTTQELTVLELVVAQLTNHEIAGRLGIATETVKSHLRHAMKKLGADDRWTAAKIATREGLV